jgi:putative spermidine/putrescine transport system permease protein
VTTVASEASAPRRLAAALWRRPTLGRWLLLALPLAWLGLVYLGSLAVLFLNAFWRLDPFTGQVVRELTFDNFITLATTEVFRTITLRTLGIAAAVTVACALIAFPIAYYMARVASRRARAVMLVAILMPLWSSYLVKVYAWRTILAGNGLLDWLLAPFGLASPGFGEFAIWLVFTYLWLPYMILPIFTALERLPPSLLEASADLGARAGFTFRRVILPITIPAVAAGSIFTFSLTIGDYITPRLVSNTKFIGNVVYENVGVAGNIPLAAAFALVPVVVMIAYLFVARRIGAFDSL